MFKLPKNVEFILDKIHEAGHEAFVVGGPVRDMLRGVTPSDYDVTTSARPEKIKEIFADMKTVDTGIQHGTVTLVLDSLPYEITTYRIDGEYLDARHPEGVEFTENLSLDLLRRDFTMNAIAYNPKVGIVDTTGGRDDVKAKIIRCVGEPSKRFSEDALRILRALRFSATLGFEIERGTADAIFDLKGNLDFVSRERVYAELKKMLCGEHAARVLDTFMPVLWGTVPEWECIKSTAGIKFSRDFTVNLIALFAKSGATADAYAERMRSLRADGATIKAGATVLSALGKYSFDRDGLIALCLDIGADYARLATRVAVCLARASAATLDLLDSIIKDTPLTLSDLKISGKDLTARGFVGEEIGKTLSELLRATAHGEVENERGALLAVAEREKNS